MVAGRFDLVYWLLKRQFVHTPWISVQLNKAQIYGKCRFYFSVLFRTQKKRQLSPITTQTIWGGGGCHP